MKRYNIFNIAGYAITYLVLLALAGLLNLWSMKFDWSVIGTVEYWVNTLTTSILYFAAYGTSVGMGVDIGPAIDDAYQKLEKDISDARKQLLTQEFTEFVIELNYENKKEAWIDHWNSKRERLIDKQTFAVAEQIEFLKTDPNMPLSRATKKYLKQEALIARYLSPQWIEANLKYRRFKYPKITRNEIINGHDGSNSKSSVLEKNIVGRAIAGRALKIVGTTVLTAIYLTMMFTSSDIGKEVIVATVITISMILVNIFTGYRKGHSLFKTKVKKNQEERLRIIYTFLKQENNKKSDDE